MVQDPKNDPKAPPQSDDRDDKFNYTSAAGLTVDNSEGEGEPFDFSLVDDDENDDEEDA